MIPVAALADLLGEAGGWAVVVIGFGMLIFIHEAGHFLAARWSGVRVEAFSLGFGPVLWGFRRGPTHYRISWIPLGGYVKMAGEVEDGAADPGPPAPDSYPAAPLWRRFVIIGAGVAMNGVLAFALYWLALVVGVSLPGTTLATVEPGRPAWRAGLRPGDEVLEADGRRLLEFMDLAHASLAGGEVTLLVRRGDREFPVTLSPDRPEGSEASGIGVGAGGGSAAPVVVDPDGAAARAGWRTGDVVVAVGGVPAGLGDDLSDQGVVAAFLEGEGPFPLRVRRADGTEAELVLAAAAAPPPRLGVAPWRDIGGVRAVRPGGEAERAGWTAGDRPLSTGPAGPAGLPGADAAPPPPSVPAFQRAVARAPAGSSVRVTTAAGVAAERPLPDGAAERLALLQDLHFAWDRGSTRVEVTPGAPADAAGVPDGATILSVAGAPVANYGQIVERIRAATAAATPEGTTGATPAGKPLPPIEIEWRHGDLRGRASGVPRPLADRVGAFPEGLALGAAERLVRAGPLEAVPAAGRRVAAAVRGIGGTLAGLFRGTVGSSNLGGPIAIGLVTRDSARKGVGSLLWVLAFLSANLMIFNLVPIPLLDGGQLALLGVEAVTGRPPSEWVMVVSSYAGLAVLLSLVVLTFWNDIARLVGG